ncbi:Gx transporter family protein [Vallitalea okinawensis]|uniref:Gx transporter family protein n=1 Tax=Vallitalea okinawensis TaxID=2078660 RepID=UPI000CFD96D8|nr:Gx transporter family protein [Vallitalea okinawensis]
MQYQISKTYNWSSTKKMVMIALMVAAAIILSYFERLIPLQLVIPVPGVKLGLANVVILTSIYLFSYREVFFIVLLKAGLVGVLFGSPITFLYSLAGSILSFLVMYILVVICKEYISSIGISVSGAIFHNIGQITMASILIETRNIFMYLPYLMLVGIITGIGVGFVVKYIIKYLRMIIPKL